jgi:hypothetical protein
LNENPNLKEIILPENIMNVPVVYSSVFPSFCSVTGISQALATEEG